METLPSRGGSGPPREPGTTANVGAGQKDGHDGDTHDTPEPATGNMAPMWQTPTSAEMVKKANEDTKTQESALVKTCIVAAFAVACTNIPCFKNCSTGAVLKAILAGAIILPFGLRRVVLRTQGGYNKYFSDWQEEDRILTERAHALVAVAGQEPRPEGVQRPPSRPDAICSRPDSSESGETGSGSGNEDESGRDLEADISGEVMVAAFHGSGDEGGYLSDASSEASIVIYPLFHELHSTQARGEEAVYDACSGHSEAGGRQDAESFDALEMAEENESCAKEPECKVTAKPRAVGESKHKEGAIPTEGDKKQQESQRTPEIEEKGATGSRRGLGSFSSARRSANDQSKWDEVGVKAGDSSGPPEPDIDAHYDVQNAGWESELPGHDTAVGIVQAKLTDEKKPTEAGRCLISIEEDIREFENQLREARDNRQADAERFRQARENSTALRIEAEQKADAAEKATAELNAQVDRQCAAISVQDTKATARRATAVARAQAICGPQSKTQTLNRVREDCTNMAVARTAWEDRTRVAQAAMCRLEVDGSRKEAELKTTQAKKTTELARYRREVKRTTRRKQQRAAQEQRRAVNAGRVVGAEEEGSIDDRKGPGERLHPQQPRLTQAGIQPERMSGGGESASGTMHQPEEAIDDLNANASTRPQVQHARQPSASSGGDTAATSDARSSPPGGIPPAARPHSQNTSHPHSSGAAAPSDTIMGPRPQGSRPGRPTAHHHAPPRSTSRSKPADNEPIRHDSSRACGIREYDKMALESKSFALGMNHRGAAGGATNQGRGRDDTKGGSEREVGQAAAEQSERQEMEHGDNQKKMPAPEVTVASHRDASHGSATGDGEDERQRASAASRASASAIPTLPRGTSALTAATEGPETENRGQVGSRSLDNGARASSESSSLAPAAILWPSTTVSTGGPAVRPVTSTLRASVPSFVPAQLNAVAHTGTSGVTNPFQSAPIATPSQAPTLPIQNAARPSPSDARAAPPVLPGLVVSSDGPIASAWTTAGAHQQNASRPTVRDHVDSDNDNTLRQPRAPLVRPDEDATPPSPQGLPFNAKAQLSALHPGPATIPALPGMGAPAGPVPRSARQQAHPSSSAAVPWTGFTLGSSRMGSDKSGSFDPARSLRRAAYLEPVEGEPVPPAQHGYASVLGRFAARRSNRYPPGLSFHQAPPNLQASTESIFSGVNVQQRSSARSIWSTQESAIRRGQDPSIHTASGGTSTGTRSRENQPPSSENHDNVVVASSTTRTVGRPNEQVQDREKTENTIGNQTTSKDHTALLPARGDNRATQTFGSNLNATSSGEDGADASNIANGPCENTEGAARMASTIGRAGKRSVMRGHSKEVAGASGEEGKRVSDANAAESAQKKLKERKEAAATRNLQLMTFLRKTKCVRLLSVFGRDEMDPDSIRLMRDTDFEKAGATKEEVCRMRRELNVLQSAYAVSGQVAGRQGGEQSSVKSGSDSDSTASEDDGPQCIICWDAKPQIQFLPCGHLVVCQQCATSITNRLCPNCRQKIKGTVRVFRS